MKTTKDNVVQVLRKFADYIETLGDYEKEKFAVDVDEMLEDIACDDGFGTERQLDPRGDGRDN